MERLRVSVSRRSLFPILTALFGLILCVGMIQRMRDPLYPMTLEYYLFLAAGGIMALLGVIAMRHFPWLCIIPAVCYVYGGVLQRWSELQGGQGTALPSEIVYYQIAMLVRCFIADWTVSPMGSLDAEGSGDHSHSDSVCHVIHGVTGCLTGVEDGGISDRCGKAYPLAAFSDE